MGVKPGYKQTEVGVIPEEWYVKPLANVFKLKHGFAFSSDYFSRSGPIVLTPGNFLLEGGLYFEERNTKRYSGSYSPSMTFRKGDLLIVMTDLTPDCNLLGKPAFVESDEIVLHNQRIGRVQLKDKTVDVQLLFYLLLSRPYLGRLREQATGSTVRHTSNKSIYGVQLAWPPPSEQRAIAEALSDVDGLLNGLDRLIAKKRDLKQAAMQQLLTGKTRLPRFHGEWEVKRLGEISDVKTGPFGSTLHESDYVKTGTPIITVEHLGEFGVQHENLPLVSDADRQRLRAYWLEVGDIVFSRVGSVDRNAIIRQTEVGWLFSGRLLRVRPNKKQAFAPFLSYQFHGETFKGAVHNVAVGQTMACLNTQILKGVSVFLPSMPEQTAIAEVLTEMDAELAALEQRREKTRALKQAMMQELLTGKTRLV